MRRGQDWSKQDCVPCLPSAGRPSVVLLAPLPLWPARVEEERGGDEEQLPLRVLDLAEPSRRNAKPSMGRAAGSPAGPANAAGERGYARGI